MARNIYIPRLNFLWWQYSIDKLLYSHSNTLSVTITYKTSLVSQNIKHTVYQRHYTISMKLYVVWHKQPELCVFSRKTTVNFTMNSQSQYCNTIKENMCCMVKCVWSLCQCPWLEVRTLWITATWDSAVYSLCIPGVYRSATLHMKLSQYLSICDPHWAHNITL